MTICIIPARSGSKRLKNKNIKNFFGKPILSYVIKIAKQSKLFSRIIVSTDSDKISRISKKFGAEVFIRSKKLSNDHIPTLEVIKDCINKLSLQKIKYHCCIYPTAVLIDPKNLIKSFNKIKKLKAEYLIAITDYGCSPLRSFNLNKKYWINFKYKKFSNFRSQDLPKSFHDTGSFYFYKTSALLKKKNQLPKKTTFFFVDRHKTEDINSLEDLQLAKLKFKLIKKNG